MGFSVVSMDGNSFEADLMAIACNYEGYFPGIPPLQSVEFVADLDGPARYVPELDKIEISERVSSFIKLCRFLVLHELINRKLYKTLGHESKYDSQEFQNELKRLWDAKAYSDLL